MKYRRQKMIDKQKSCLEEKKMSVKIIYFVHGTTKDNIKHKSTGWLPGELSKKGIKQSIELKEQINIDDIDLVIKI